MAVKVLYVEDARAFHRIVHRMLEDVCELSIAATLEEAWGQISRERFNLIICDFMFPEGDAFPLIFKIRKQYSAVELPIIMLTSAADRVSVGKFHGSGVNVTVRKIPEAENFRGLVYRMMRQPWVDAPAVPSGGDVQLVAWTTATQSFVYCPNLRSETTGATPEEAMARMHERIANHLETGTALPTISAAKTTRYVPPLRDPVDGSEPATANAAMT